MQYVIPALIILMIVLGIIKKVPIYDAFVAGAKKAIPLCIKIFPYIAAVMIMCEVFEASGLDNALIGALSPIFSVVGIPAELIKLVLVKPFSGSGSLAVLSDIISTYGADSYLARTAAVIFGSSETTFYVGAVYFAGVKNKKLTAAIVISLVSTFASTIVAAFVCRLL